MNCNHSRRDLLIGGSRALLAGACLPTMRGLQKMQESALASLASEGGGAGYKALVCVFLDGGNDSFNMIVPRDAAGHAVYSVSRGQLAVPQGQLLPILPTSGGDTRQWGVHPAAPQLRDLFEAGTMAIVGNVGTLLAPMTKAQYVNGTVPKPAQLFSHSDQSTLWQLPSARDDVAHGWGGRMADLVLSMNTGALSPAISVAGSTRLLRGQTVVPYSIGTDGSTPLNGTWGAAGTHRLQTLRQILGAAQGSAMAREFADLHDQAIELDGLIRGALNAAVPLGTAFPANFLAQQLRMVARMISVRQPLGALRQVFFVRQGGYDTHDEQLAKHPQLLAELGSALAAFQAAMVELGVETEVTTCTLSEFGRTLTSNGRGSDHGWGGNQLVMGGAVQGRRIFGAMPNLALGGPDDGGLGRIIPTTAVEQMSATLANWFGVPSGEMNSLFPRLAQFATPDLGFMA
ncbi:MAG TPA: DUF1501 domain-containing protein [Planctomycetota bacterium]|nr:DUF1501 domain-containing protein [Planctomycetota bacterium]